MTKRASKAEKRRRAEARKLALERAAAARQRNARLRKAEAKKRSEAAKRGAETKRRKAAEKAAKAERRSEAAKRAAKTRAKNKARKEKGLPPLASKRKPRGKSKKQIIKELEERNRALQEGIRVANERGVEWVKQDGTVATMPSILRHVPAASTLLDSLESVAEMSGEDFWALLRKSAEQQGLTLKEAYALMRDSGDSVFSSAFRRRARMIASVEGVSLREVYTLWFSP